uniref:Complement C1q tumor necrosis factor-related protein 3-like n=1 Tax=Crassostrea virginica TaxID=6565 RepID=A0A8B8BAP2_CRAVI|nr:complement C1q tumor necrosis factor-related protein 3-like [Crassostrea virginica]
MFAFICFSLLNMVIAETLNQEVFLKNLNSYKIICKGMEWEPPCDGEKIKSKAVAFQVYLKNSITSLGNGQILKYDQLVTNIGGGYNTTTGKFTAPADGVYSFSWTYMTKKGAACYIGGVVNGRQLVWSAIHDQAATWISTTAHLVVQMKKGSEFWTPNFTGIAVYMHHHYTFLTGHKISD